MAKIECVSRGTRFGITVPSEAALPLLPGKTQPFNLLPGTAIEFMEREPFEGDFVVRVAGETVRVAPQAAAQIFVGAAADEAQP